MRARYLLAPRERPATNDQQSTNKTCCIINRREQLVVYWPLCRAKSEHSKGVRFPEGSDSTRFIHAVPKVFLLEN